MKVKELIGTYAGNAIIERLVQHDDGNEYVHVYTGSPSFIDDAAIKDSEIILLQTVTKWGNPFLDITIE